MTEEEARQENTQSQAFQPDREAESLKTSINEFCSPLSTNLTLAGYRRKPQ
jgi:hypothetical protein